MGVATARPFLSVWQRPITRYPPESGGLAKQAVELKTVQRAKHTQPTSRALTAKWGQVLITRGRVRCELRVL